MRQSMRRQLPARFAGRDGQELFIEKSPVAQEKRVVERLLLAVSSFDLVRRFLAFAQPLKDFAFLASGLINGELRKAFALGGVEFGLQLAANGRGRFFTNREELQDRSGVSGLDGAQFFASGAGGLIAKSLDLGAQPGHLRGECEEAILFLALEAFAQAQK